MKILIVDDEPLARARLLRLLSQHADCEWIAEAANGMEAIACNEAREPDIVLMDIRMPGMDGLEAARHIMQGQRPPAVIFCTAYEEYAVAAFESRAVGYLLKPVQRDKLLSAIEAARTTTRLQIGELARDSGQQRRFLSARSMGATRLVAIDEVRLLMADQKYVSAYYPEGSLLLDESLRELEAEFPARFLRVHRNALVARAHIRSLQRSGDGESVITLDGIEAVAQVSRRHLAEIREIIQRL